jgi:catechol 2,3-dioxygenase-like lactoylglutathione lyase family enzyme
VRRSRHSSLVQLRLVLTLVTLVVRDYDEAIAYFRDRLGFELLEDSPREGGKRWVRVAPRGGSSPRDGGAALLLARAATPEQLQSVGRQAGGRVAYFLETDDFQRDYDAFRARGVEFLEAPREESYGTVAVFRDLYGNRWDLLQLRTG